MAHIFRRQSELFLSKNQFLCRLNRERFIVGFREERMGTIMKRARCNYWLGTSLAAAALLMVATAWADNDPNAGANAPAQPGQSDTSSDQREQRVSGRITAVDTAAQTITVKGTLLSKVIKVGSDAQIAIEGNASAALSDLKVGDRVEVSYRTEGDTLIAQRITRTSSGSKESQGGPPSGSY
jgi:Cu/Ag efflux protein CusF